MNCDFLSLFLGEMKMKLLRERGIGPELLILLISFNLQADNLSLHLLNFLMYFLVTWA